MRNQKVAVPEPNPEGGLFTDQSSGKPKGNRVAPICMETDASISNRDIASATNLTRLEQSNGEAGPVAHDGADSQSETRTGKRSRKRPPPLSHLAAPDGNALGAIQIQIEEDNDSKNAVGKENTTVAEGTESSPSRMGAVLQVPSTPTNQSSIPPTPMSSRRRWGAWAESISTLLNRNISSKLRGPMEGSGNLLAVPGAPVNVAVAFRFTQDAMEGRQKNGKGGLFFRSIWVQFCFLLNINPYWVKFVYFLSILHCLLVIFEPASRSDATPGWVLALEAVIILLYYVDILLKVAYVGHKKYIRKRQHQMQTAVTTAFLTDWVIYIIIGTPRFSRLLRPGVLMVRNRELRKTVNVLIKMLPELLGLFAGMAAYLLFFGLLGVHLFQDDYHEYVPPTGAEAFGRTGAFDNIGSAFLRLYVLFSTENYPEIALPAYAANSWSVLYFITFMYCGTFFLQSIILATIVSIYLERATKTVAKERKKEWKTLATAFTLLDEDRKGCITFETWTQLFQALRPSASLDETRFYFDLLDRENNGTIDTLDFLDFREISQLRLRPMQNRHRRHWWLESTWIGQAADSHIGALVSNGLIILNTGVACVHWRGMEYDEERAVLLTNVGLFALMIIGIVMHLVADGVKVYFGDFYNRLDLCCVLLAGPLYAITLATSEVDELAAIANLLLFIRLSWKLNHGRLLLSLFGRVVPPMFYMTLFVLCAMYSFAILGMELFYGVHSANPHDAYFYEYDCSFGFDSFGCAMLALFQCITTSNWHEIMNSLMDHFRDASALYFVMFFLVVNLILMNLMVAVTIEAFMSARKSVKIEQKRKRVSNQALVNLGGIHVRHSNVSNDSMEINGTPPENVSFAAQSSVSPSVAEEHEDGDVVEVNEPLKVYGDAQSKSSDSAARTKRVSIRSIESSASASSSGSLNPEARNQSLVRRLWRSAAMRATDSTLGTQSRPLSPVDEVPSGQKSQTFVVTRRHGGWRRELVQTKDDAISALETDDIKAIGKASGREDIAALLAKKRENMRFLAQKGEAGVRGSLPDSAGSSEPKVALTLSALKHPSPLLRRYGSDSIVRGTVNVIPEGGYDSDMGLLSDSQDANDNIPAHDGADQSNGQSPDIVGGEIIEKCETPVSSESIHSAHMDNDGDAVSQLSSIVTEEIHSDRVSEISSIFDASSETNQQPPQSLWIQKKDIITKYARERIARTKKAVAQAQASGANSSDSDTSESESEEDEREKRRKSSRTWLRKTMAFGEIGSSTDRGRGRRASVSSLGRTASEPRLRRWTTETSALEKAVAAFQENIRSKGNEASSKVPPKRLSVDKSLSSEV